MNTYYTFTLQPNLRLSGPTNFTPILKNMISNVNPKNLFE